MDIVIKYDPSSEEYNFYESTTQTLLKSKSLSEGLLSLNLFLQSQDGIKSDIFNIPDATYHVDSISMKEIVMGNMKLLKRLKNDQSQFKKSSNKFNGDSSGQGYKTKKDFSHSNRNFGRGNFGGKSSFNDSYKKWGNK